MIRPPVRALPLVLVKRPGDVGPLAVSDAPVSLGAGSMVPGATPVWIGSAPS